MNLAREEANLERLLDISKGRRSVVFSLHVGTLIGKILVHFPL